MRYSQFVSVNLLIKKKDTRKSKRKLHPGKKVWLRMRRDSLPYRHYFRAERSINRLFIRGILPRRARAWLSSAKFPSPQPSTVNKSKTAAIYSRAKNTPTEHAKTAKKLKANSYLPSYPHSLFGASSSQRRSKNWKSRLPAWPTWRNKRAQKN